MARGLGYRGEQVLGLVTAAKHSGQRPPSYAAIAAVLDISTVADVANIVRRLERRGYLTRRDTGTRHRAGWHEPVIEITQTT